MLSEYRQRFSEFHTALHRENYLFGSGRKDQRETAHIWSEFSDLFQPSAIAELRAQLAETAEHRTTERTSIARLIGFAITGNLEAHGRELAAGIENYEESRRIEWNGQKINLAQAAELLVHEADSTRRRQLAAQRADALSGAQDLWAELWAKQHEATRALGYENYLAMLRELRGGDYERLAAAASKFLTKTESYYARALAPLLTREAHISPDEASAADLAFLRGYARFDHFLARGRMLEIYHALFADLGFKTEKQTNVEIDATPPRRAQTFCAPIQVPDEIKLVAELRGGQADYREFLRATGHTQHFAWTSRHLYPEFRIGGDAAVTEAWGLLLANLLHDEHWLAITFGFVESGSFRHALAVFNLLVVRRQAALLNYEVEFHAGSLSGNAGARYAELMRDAARVHYDEAEHLRALSDPFHSASLLRAAAFEAQLRDYLKTKFGVRWWATRKAGEMLIDTWNTGRQYTLEELAALLGLGELDFDSLAAEMIEPVAA